MCLCGHKFKSVGKESQGPAWREIRLTGKALVHWDRSHTHLPLARSDGMAGSGHGSRE